MIFIFEISCPCSCMVYTLQKVLKLLYFLTLLLLKTAQRYLRGNFWKRKIWIADNTIFLVTHFHFPNTQRINFFTCIFRESFTSSLTIYSNYWRFIQNIDDLFKLLTIYSNYWRFIQTINDLFKLLTIYSNYWRFTIYLKSYLSHLRIYECFRTFKKNRIDRALRAQNQSNNNR